MQTKMNYPTRQAKKRTIPHGEIDPQLITVVLLINAFTNSSLFGGSQLFEYPFASVSTC